ncbi:hypothetical protein Ssi03_74500 [Sphaerisporangium siamense]|uniref:Uncharacterized protein n=1 Tax=Sphaerisporangium siamense TaxID=795645 RepID=A0A7W7D8P9_9ACTN|nr:hypothetical protein [Sphaerisporangium siamense]MBB4702302.1 hypothetical protein [Sphaerisporangium siamense]GII89460.1 hypothetical protein Ssi03_74500 [Sphaerisporangium siamense]
MATTQKFRTLGGVLTTWTETGLSAPHGRAGGRYPVGTVTCQGCGHSRRDVSPQAAGSHAEKCRRVP